MTSRILSLLSVTWPKSDEHHLHLMGVFSGCLTVILLGLLSILTFSSAHAAMSFPPGGEPENCIIEFDSATWIELPANDDASVGPIALPFTFDLYGESYNSLFLNNNGNVSFDNPYWWYTSTGFPITTPMVAPFWADVDTRNWGPGGYRGEVWYTVTPTAFIVTFYRVGPFNAMSATTQGMESTFTLVMTDGTDPLLEPGNNVGFFYGDMGWTTGQASGSGNGFDGSPATVGINSGNGVDYILLGMFNQNTTDYDGPGGDNDGVLWLENQCFEFNVSSATNFPPVATQFPHNNTVNLCLGSTQTLHLGFTGPETNQTASVVINNNGWSGAQVVSNTPGNPSQTTLELTGTEEGTYTVTVTATDNHPEAETTVRTITVNVVDCYCAAAPMATCSGPVSGTTDFNACEGFVTVPAPELSLPCFSNTALDFTGNNAHLSLNDPVNNGDFSIEFWFKPSSTNWSGVFYNMSSPNSGGQNRPFYLEGSNNNLRFTYRGATAGTSTMNVNVNLSEARWYHVAVTGGFGSNEQKRMYLDGNLIANNNSNVGNKSPNYGAPRIGRASSNNWPNQGPFNGQIDNFRMYNVRLTAEQVDQVACGDLSEVLSNLTLSLDFEEGSGTLAADQSVFTNHASLVNMNNSAWVTSDLVTVCTTLINDYTGTSDASATYPTGTTEITWTATGAFGNASTCTQTVTVEDNEAPVAVCEAITIGLDANGVATITHEDIDGGSSDNCGIVSYSIDQDTFTCADLANPIVISSTDGYEVAVFLNAISVNPSSTNCQWGYNYTVSIEYDIQINGVNAPASLWTLQGTIGCGSSTHFFGLPNGGRSGIATTANGWSSNTDCATVTPASLGCDEITLQVHGPGIPSTFVSIPPVGGTPVTLTVEDAAGNTDSCTALVTVVDQLAPEVVCQNAVVTLNSAGTGVLHISDVDAGSSDNCGIEHMSLSQTAFDCSDLDEQTVTLSAWDATGNLAQFTAQVTVIDSEVPTIVCAADLNLSTDAGSCFATVVLNTPATSDNCGVASVTNDAPAQFPIGSTTVTWTVTDNAGNTATCEQIVVVEDTEAPTIFCNEAITSDAEPGECAAFVTVITPVVHDNCGVANLVNDVTNTSDASGVYPVGQTVITWTVTDNAGNSTSCTQLVTVLDNELPEIVCPQDLVLENDSLVCGAVVAYELPAATDNCGVLTYELLSGLASGEVFPVGTTEVVYAVYDASGNAAQCTFFVTVNDVEAPVVECPSDRELSADPGQCGATVVYDLPVGWDNCGTLDTVLLAGLESGAFFPIGSTEVIYQITDAAGSSVICSFTVNVTDDEAPALSVCPTDFVMENTPGECGAFVNYSLPNATDNCGVVESELTEGLASGSLFPIGNTVVTYTFTDEAGNASTCSFTVTVIDTEAPMVQCLNNYTVGTDNGQCGATLSIAAPPATDNCGAVSVEQVSGPAHGDFVEPGSYTVVFNIVDENGNAVECAYIITVEDTEAPQIECIDDIVQTTPEVDFEDPEVSDNCYAGLTMIEGLPSGSEFPHGYTTITYVAEDLAGNTDTCSFTVLINQPPVAENDSTFIGWDAKDVVVNVLDNDYDPDGDEITISDASANNGFVYISFNSLVYVPNEGWCGTDTITYVICDPFGACDTALVFIEVECDYDVFIPEGFSPNGDGVNDVFEILGLHRYPDNRLTIYNRWGRKVYEAREYQNDWDGYSQDRLTVGNGLLPEGTDFVVLELGDSGRKPMKSYVYINH